MKLKKTIFFIAALINLASSAYAQKKNEGSFINLSLTAGLGNRFDRIGVNVSGYYYHNFFQTNGAIRLYYNFRNLGPKEKKYFELNTNIGVCFGMGKHDTIYNPFISAVGNQTIRKNSIAYSYNWYYNQAKINQVTGMLSFQFENFNLICENDLLARDYWDRFRTGAFLLDYRYKDLKVGINTTIWTGENGTAVYDTTFPSRFGYWDMSKSRYGNISHGLLSVQAQYAVPTTIPNSTQQIVQANMGVDWEKVRNVVQNKFIHDMWFIPTKWIGLKNLHIPMISETGEPYMYKPGQKIKKPVFYYNSFLNPNVFY